MRHVPAPAPFPTHPPTHTLTHTPQAYLEDCSSNGTMINQDRILGRMLLQDSDIISIGERSFRFEYAKEMVGLAAC